MKGALAGPFTTLIRSSSSVTFLVFFLVFYQHVFGWLYYKRQFWGNTITLRTYFLIRTFRYIFVWSSHIPPFFPMCLTLHSNCTRFITIFIAPIHLPSVEIIVCSSYLLHTESMFWVFFSNSNSICKRQWFFQYATSSGTYIQSVHTKLGLMNTWLIRAQQAATAHCTAFSANQRRQCMDYPLMI